MELPFLNELEFLLRIILSGIWATAGIGMAIVSGLYLDNGFVEVKLSFKRPASPPLLDLIAELNENPQVKIIEK